MMDRYYVTSVAGINISDIDDDLLSEYGSATVPERQVDIADKLASSSRVTEFILSQDEAKALQADPRVQSVERHLRPDEYEIVAEGSQTGDFTRNNWDTDDYPNLKNWGLMRCTAKGNSNYQKNGLKWEHIDHPNEIYKYNSAGDGVDIVIMDYGVQADHPEFLDENGVSRVQHIEWEDTLADMGWEDSYWGSSTKEYRKPENYYQELHTNHGTHCASIAAGNDYGWAKKAHIYVCNIPKPAFSEGDSNGGDLPFMWWPRLLHWVKERKKSGNKRPVVFSVSLSMYYLNYNYISASQATQGRYRGTDWTRGDKTNQDLLTDYGIETSKFSLYQSWASTIIEEIVEEGAHVVFAAGNTNNRLVKKDHQDFDNYFRINTSSELSGVLDVYYNRGSWTGTNILQVGAIDNDPLNDEQERISSYSNRGQGVDLYAPADYSMSATGGGSSWTGTKYTPPDYSSHDIAFFSGTSCACPQVAGIIACYLSVKPHLTPSDMIKILLNQADTGSIWESPGISAHAGHFLDSNNKIAYMPHTYGTNLTYYNQTLSNVLIGGNWKISRTLKTDERDLIPDRYYRDVTGYFEGYEVDSRTSVRTDRQYGTLDQDNFSPINLYATIKGIFYKYDEATNTTTFNLKVTGDIQNSGWEVLYLNIDRRGTRSTIYRRKDATWIESIGTWQWNISGRAFMVYGATYYIGIV